MGGWVGFVSKDSSIFIKGGLSANEALKTQVKGKGKNQNTVSSKEAGLLPPCSWLRRKPALIWKERLKEAEGRVGMCGMNPHGLAQPVFKGS